MKKLLNIICFFFISLSCSFAQDKGYKIGLWGAYNQHPVIVSNKQMTNGGRWVKGSEFIPTVKNSSLKEGDKVICKIGLSVEKIGNDDPEYFLDISLSTSELSNMSVYKDSPLLVKLANDDVVRLECRKDAIDNIGTIISLLYNVTSYVASPQYSISSEDIDRFADGIKKIRLEANAEKWDFEFNRHKKDELGEFLYIEKKLITETLNSQTAFDEDF